MVGPGLVGNRPASRSHPGLAGAFSVPFYQSHRYSHPHDHPDVDAIVYTGRRDRHADPIQHADSRHLDTAAIANHTGAFFAHANRHPPAAASNGFCHADAAVVHGYADRGAAVAHGHADRNAHAGNAPSTFSTPAAPAAAWKPRGAGRSYANG